MSVTASKAAIPPPTAIAIFVRRADCAARACVSSGAVCVVGRAVVTVARLATDSGACGKFGPLTDVATSVGSRPSSSIDCFIARYASRTASCISIALCQRSFIANASARSTTSLTAFGSSGRYSAIGFAGTDIAPRRTSFIVSASCTW